MMRTSQKQTTVHKKTDTDSPAQQTFMDHIHELQSRLFYIALVFLVSAGIAYPFFTQISKWIVAPLGKQELIYLTPGGAFGFIIKVCMYVGLIATLPFVIYHLFRFLSPVMPSVKRKQLVLFTVSSFVLAIIGVLFAYYISLPASLYFLTSFSLDSITPMLTIDSYFSFAMAYLIAGALLFQLPLVLMIIDSITPLTPKILMSYQRQVILGSVIIAAVISPTPDAMNQMLLAAPLITMYQAGIGVVGIQNARRKRSSITRGITRPVDEQDDIEGVLSYMQETSSQPLQEPQKAHITVTDKVAQEKAFTQTQHNVESKSVDGFSARSQRVTLPSRSTMSPAYRDVITQRSRQSLDGMKVTARTYTSSI
ncbi:MAG: twin-arginine translocase subunit TatC [Candidatus Saccharimonadales bacterium]